MTARTTRIAAPARSRVPDEPTEYAGMVEPEPDEDGPAIVVPTLTVTVVECVMDPLASETMTVYVPSATGVE